VNTALCEIENEIRDMDNMIDLFAEQVSIGKENGSKSTGGRCEKKEFIQGHKDH